MRAAMIGRWAAWVLVAAGVALSGCSTTSGNRFTLLPEGHPLTETAKALRAAQPEPWPLPRELDKRVLPAYVVEPGDVLLVQPADLESAIRLPADQPVLPDGTINLGRFGQLVVAGKTVQEIEVVVRAQIQTYLQNHPAETRDTGTAGGAPPLPKPQDVGPITVRIVTRVSKVYYVLGEVNAPGSFTLNGRETVLDGIVAAGGLNDRASRRNIILVRPTTPNGCRIVLPVCYRDIVQVGDTSTNYQLAPGDRIYVPTRSCWEDLFHNKPECPPCNRPQVPCQPPPAGHPQGPSPAGPFVLPPAHEAVPALAPGPMPLTQEQLRRAVPVARPSPPRDGLFLRVAAFFDD
jgi:polysaccharide biosynthesis/export protein